MKTLHKYFLYQLYFILTVFGLNNPLRNKLRKQLGSGHLRNHVKAIINVMIMAIVSYTHPRVFIKWPGNSLKVAAEVANVAQSVHDKCAASTWLSGITGLAAVLTALQDLIDDLLEKAATAKGGGKEDKTNLEDAINLIQTSGTQAIINIVQGKVYTLKDSAQAIVDSCGMNLKLSGGRDAQVWSVVRIAKGSVELAGSVKGLKVRYVIQWQQTQTPQTEESWYLKANEIIPSSKGTRIVTGLPLGKEVFFRYRLIVGGIEEQWSDVISLYIS
jgi:hypothetical protein